MQTINMHEAKTQLSKLVQKASDGEPFVIAKAGKPMVQVTAVSDPGQGKIRRLGFLTGQISVPEDFDQMGSDKINALFGGEN